MLFALRTTFYSLLLLVGLAQSAISIFAAMIPVIASAMRFFSVASILFVFPSWIMTSVMLSYNGKHLSKYPLTRPYSHQVVFSIIAVTWLLFAIAFASQTPIECNYKEPSDGLADLWCFVGKLEIGFSCGMIIFAGASIFSIRLTMKRNNIGLAGNIASGDKKSAGRLEASTNFHELA